MDAIDLSDAPAAADARAPERAAATDLTGYLVGLPSLGLRWTIQEVETIQRLRREREHAARSAAAARDGG